MTDALNATGRPILYSLCNWGQDQPWVWGPSVGNSWRIAGDIFDNFGEISPNCIVYVFPRSKQFMFILVLNIHIAQAHQRKREVTNVPLQIL